jgi:hypothetical protein
MTFPPPPPTTVVLKPAGGVLCTSAMPAAVTINLVKQVNYPRLCRKPRLSLHAMRNRQRHWHTNRSPLTTANPTKASIVSAPPALSP